MSEKRTRPLCKASLRRTKGRRLCVFYAGHKGRHRAAEPTGKTAWIEFKEPRA